VLTRRGWSLLGATIGLWIGSRVLGLVQLVVLAGIGVLLLVVAATWVRVHPALLVAHRHLRERLQVGVDGRVDVVVESAAPRRLPTLAVADAFDRGRRSARFLLAPLEPGEAARAAYRLPTERRGRFELGPLRVTVSDPFGMASRTTRVLGNEEVIVFPRVHEIIPLPEIGGDELDRDMPRAHGRLDPGGEFLNLRDYEPGDDLRRVHWRSTARRQRLMVRQNEARRRTPVLVLLDVRRSSHDHVSFERAVEAAASVVNACERAGRPWELVLSTGALIGASGRRHLTSVMDELAVVEPHGGDGFGIIATRRRASALVAVMGNMRGDDSGVLNMLLRGGGMLAVVTTMPEGAGVWVRSRRFRPIVVPYGADDNLTTTWNTTVFRWQRSARLPLSASPARA
jgi:uncharacterized protein (DUF58 family)